MIIKRDAYFTPAGKIRPLHIYLPEEYDRSDESYPVMYFFDGHNLFSDSDATYGKSWGLKTFLDRWPKPMIIVGIECGHEGRERLIEYCPYHFQTGFFGDLPGTGDATLRWMIEELKPMIDREYRTQPFRECTAIGGSSMGGLMSLYAAIRYNRWFSKAACLSSAISPAMRGLIDDIDRSPLSADTRVYLSWGTEEAGGAAGSHSGDMATPTARNNLAIADLLGAHAVHTRVYCQRGGRHCEADWEKQVPRFMNYLWLDQ
ncbi:MAG: alpha/beta hydrolase-fold protein [Clostridia bacterium]|nr:alpha/beta hydrolase-fold protein [Clostridia bacterium]